MKVTRHKLNLSNNQFTKQGKTVLLVTHYKDGHYSVAVNGNRAVRVNALTAATLVGNSEELSFVTFVLQRTKKEV